MMYNVSSLQDFQGYVFSSRARKDFFEIIESGIIISIIHTGGGVFFNSGTFLENSYWGFLFGTLAKCSFLIQDKLFPAYSSHLNTASRLFSAMVISKISTAHTSYFFCEGVFQSHHEKLLCGYLLCTYLFGKVAHYFSSDFFWNRI